MTEAYVRLPTPAHPPYAGRFVVLEGGEGVGKSTQLALLGAHLAARGVAHVLTREPGGTPAAEAIREVALSPRYVGLDPRAEALLFAAARAEHVRAVVRPALERGEVVVSDRYLDSSIAYQGVARALGADVVAGLSLWATGGLVPDLTIVLDADPATGLARVGDPDRLEQEAIEFHASVRTAFLELAARSPASHLVLDAGADRESIAARIAAAVDAVREGEP